MLTETVEMKLSKRGEYGLRAMIDFAIAKQLGHPLVRIGELAEKERLPIKFLEQILMQLKEAGYLQSKRGSKGGYFLAVPADSIKLGDVIRLIDGPIAPISCLSATAYEPCSCPDPEHCGLQMAMRDVHQAITSIVDRVTLADTVRRTLRKIRRNHAVVPFVDELLPRPFAQKSARKTTPKKRPAKPASKAKTQRRSAKSSLTKKRPAKSRKSSTAKPVVSEGRTNLLKSKRHS